MSQTDTSPLPSLMNPGAALLDPVRGPAQAVTALLVAAAGLLVFLLVWAALARLDITASGQGSVVPSSQIQLVQNLEGGILQAILVREGDRVARGDVVAHIDDTGIASSYREDLSTFRSLQASVARLTAEAEGAPLAFPADLAAADDGPALIAAETAFYASRAQELQDTITVLERQGEQARAGREDAQERIRFLDSKRRSAVSELVLVRKQVDQGLISVVEQLQLERLIADTDEKLSGARGDITRFTIEIEELASRIAEQRSIFVAEAREQLAMRQAELAALRERLVAHRDRVGRRDVRAPANGIVKRVATLTPGAVIEPGGTIMEIVPVDDALSIEVRIAPADIAFIQPGQEAKVRLTAYDFSVYGALPGRVERVGADTITTRDDERYFPVTVRVDETALQDRQADLPIIPGMVADVSVVTGERTILDYILKPVLKLQERALQER